MELSAQKLKTFLSFTGQAQAAMDFYVTVFPNATIDSITLYEEGQTMGDLGTVLNGSMTIYGQQLLFMDMPASYPAPEFTWSTSLFVTCDTEEEFHKIFDQLKNNGTVMMGPEAVMGIRLCAWVTDQFGVTWQLVWI